MGLAWRERAPSSESEVDGLLDTALLMGVLKYIRTGHGVGLSFYYNGGGGAIISRNFTVGQRQQAFAHAFE